MLYNVEKRFLGLDMKTIKVPLSFSLEQTFECGQCFRWQMNEDKSYTGVAGGKVFKLDLADGELKIMSSDEDCEEYITEYLDLNRDYDDICQKVAIDDYMKTVSAFGCGIRILNQEPWEALCSFIISQCNNIPRIKGIISKLCLLYGDKIELDNECFYTFPSAERIANLTEEDLAPLRSGYRAPYIINAAREVASGLLDFDKLRAMDTKSAKAELKKLNGVGEKVASCMLLFGLHKLDAFPVDVWMKRAVEKSFGKGFDPEKAFGEYAGVAQQYIFYHAYVTKLSE